MMITGCILAALALGALIYLAVKLTISFLKKYRTKKGTTIIVEEVRHLVKEAPRMNLDDLPDDDDVIIAEYDEEEDKLVQDLSVGNDVDDKVRSMLKNNGGIVIFE